MLKITVNAAAKINLFLEIISKRDDSYHELKTVMQAVDLYDTITIRKFLIDKKIHLEGDFLKLCSPTKNTAYLAAKAFLNEVEVQEGIFISCKKRIPQGAGLAGGSTDAAAVLFGLNELFLKKISIKKLCEIGKGIGADVPFCLMGGCHFATGIGDKLLKIHTFDKYFIVTAKPNFSVSTKRAYEFYDDATHISQNNNAEYSFRDPDKILNALKNENLLDLSKNLYNRFEDILNLKEIYKIKEDFMKMGALGSLMSGSGSSVFGIFNEKEKASACFDNFKKVFKEVFFCRPIGHGVKILNNKKISSR
ncbi:MAG: 4-(cytidine 5'-diphospho)-2-C-methyl-D-erythritol kinase [Oscillospiraceae bacterium]|nr:4-(cytidine 5'-diphospho)-2-C-methyl-D-erythritol kinase [Oscillospiraceae bacterium]